MNQTCQKRLTRFVQDLGTETDAVRKTILSLSAMINALRAFNGAGKAFPPILAQLIHILRSTLPHVIPLNHILDYFELDLARDLTMDLSPEAAMAKVVQALEQRISQVERSREALAGQGAQHVSGSDRILVHGAGDGLKALLLRARQAGQRSFSVSVLDGQAASGLANAGIRVEVTAKDALSPGAVDKLFIGPMSVTGDKKVLAPAGTADLIRRCRKHHIPVYLFSDSLHYTRTRSLDLPVFHPETPMDGVLAESHERLGLDMVDHWITEMGEVSHEGRVLAPPVPLCPEETHDCLPVFAPHPGLPEMISA